MAPSRPSETDGPQLDVNASGTFSIPAARLFRSPEVQRQIRETAQLTAGEMSDRSTTSRSE